MSEERPSEEKKEEKSAPVWSCQMTPGETPLTVGSLQTLVCNGDPILTWQSDKLKIQFEDETLNYSLVILKSENVDIQAMTLVTTSYKSGNFEQPHFFITDGIQSVKVTDLSWTVESVLQGKEDKPVPSIGPMSLSMPWWFWSGIAFIAAIVLGIVILKIKRLWDRRKLIEELMSHSTALTPFNQFNKDMRTHVRNWQQVEILGQKSEALLARDKVVELIEKTFKQYLMRELLIPTLDWSHSEVLNEIKRRFSRIYDETSGDLIKLFREFSEIHKGKEQKKELSSLDCEQLVGMVRRTAEQIYQVKTRGRS